MVDYKRGYTEKLKGWTVQNDTSEMNIWLCDCQNPQNYKNWPAQNVSFTEYKLKENKPPDVEGSQDRMDIVTSDTNCIVWHNLTKESGGEQQLSYWTMFGLETIKLLTKRPVHKHWTLSKETVAGVSQVSCC